MTGDLDHLPPDRRYEVEEFVLRTILTTFEDAHTRSVTGWKKKGRIHKIMLYGSFARGGWVYEPHTKKGYSSDYDLLIIVNRKQVVENTNYWAALEERFLKAKEAGRIKSLPSLIIHTRQEVHSALSMGRYFFNDVIKDGVALYKADDVEFPKEKPKTAAQKLALAEEYFGDWFSSAGEFYESYLFSLARERLHNAAFQLHQAVEHLYNSVLLTLTFYSPHNHNIRALRSMADSLDRRLVYAWPTDFRWQRSAFNILRDAYVKARYCRPGYRITPEQLRWLGEMTQELSEVVRIICQERIEMLRTEATNPTQERSRNGIHVSGTTVKEESK